MPRAQTYWPPTIIHRPMMTIYLVSHLPTILPFVFLLVLWYATLSRKQKILPLGLTRTGPHLSAQPRAASHFPATDFSLKQFPQWPLNFCPHTYYLDDTSSAFKARSRFISYAMQFRSLFSIEDIFTTLQKKCNCFVYLKKRRRFYSDNYCLITLVSTFLHFLEIIISQHLLPLLERAGFWLTVTVCLTRVVLTPVFCLLSHYLSRMYSIMEENSSRLLWTFLRHSHKLARCRAKIFPIRDSNVFLSIKRTASVLPSHPG